MADYDKTQRSSYLLYSDVNNLYGWAMCSNMPISDFQWVPVSELFTVLQTYDNDTYGYILEVDLEYPQELHDTHRWYPFCPEHKVPPNASVNQTKLLLTLDNKERYVIHYRMLKFVMSNGLLLRKVHKILKFKQSAWIKPYIEKNTIERSNAENHFTRNLFKLMSNCIYGKTMENVRERVDIKLRSKWNGRYGARVLITDPRFKKCTVFSENLVAIELQKTIVKMMKPIVVGFAVLEISKLKMYQFHYEYMLPKFGSDCILNYSDTDSFIYTVFCNDLYKECIKKDAHLFDTSNYKKKNEYGIKQSEKTLGLMKDENGGKIMTEFVGLRAKMYSLRVNAVDTVKKAKGIRGYVLKKNITFDDYVNCIRRNESTSGIQNRIHSKLHSVYSIAQTKKMLCPFDNKRKVLSDGIDTLPWGHYSI